RLNSSAEIPIRAAASSRVYVWAMRGLGRGGDGGTVQTAHLRILTPGGANTSEDVGAPRAERTGGQTGTGRDGSAAANTPNSPAGSPVRRVVARPAWA